VTSDGTKPMTLSRIQRLTRVFTKPVRRAALTSLLLSPAFADIGCQHIGPPTIAEDRIAYNEAIASSWKEQIPLNIVRLRYSDMADFVDVSTLSQNYTLTRQTTASFGASILPWDRVMNTLMPSLMGSRTKSDNPTVTYTPQSGSDFTRNLIAPIKPYELFNLIEEGYHDVMKLAVISINDIHNEPTNIKFRTLAIAIKEAYCKGDIRFPTEIDPDSKDKKVFMVIEEQDSKPSNVPCPGDPRYSPRSPVLYPVAFIREALGLKPAVTKFEIVVGARPTTDTEIAVRTHSAISAMIWLSQYVHLPESSIAKYPKKFFKRRVPKDPDPPLTVYTSSTKPAENDKYAVIKYQDNWFYISGDDYRSNQALIYLRTMLALADTGARPTAPVLTLPVSR
jgi:hypothetical protein